MKFVKNKIIGAISLSALVLTFLFVGCCGGEDDAVIYRGTSSYVVLVEDSEGVPLGGIYCTLRNDKISADPLAYGETYPYPEQDNLESGTPTDYYIVINDSSTGKRNDAYEENRIVYFSDLGGTDAQIGYHRTKITLKSVEK